MHGASCGAANDPEFLRAMRCFYADIDVGASFRDGMVHGSAGEGSERASAYDTSMVHFNVLRLLRTARGEILGTFLLQSQGRVLPPITCV